MSELGLDQFFKTTKAILSTTSSTRVGTVELKKPPRYMNPFEIRLVHIHCDKFYSAHMIIIKIIEQLEPEQLVDAGHSLMDLVSVLLKINFSVLHIKLTNSQSITDMIDLVDIFDTYYEMKPRKKSVYLDFC